MNHERWTVGYRSKDTPDAGLATVRIRRFDPQTDNEAYYQEFAGVPFQGRSVLEVLHMIYEERDPSLAYRRLCTRGFCGSCFVVVNGEPVLSCHAPAQQEMTIEPHPKFPVVRDLVVDLDHPAGVEGLGAAPSAARLAPAAQCR